MHGVCFRGGGREGEDGGLKCKTIAMRGLKVLLNGGWWAKRLTSLIGSLINQVNCCSVATLATDAPAIPISNFHRITLW